VADDFLGDYIGRVPNNAFVFIGALNPAAASVFD